MRKMKLSILTILLWGISIIVYCQNSNKSIAQNSSSYFDLSILKPNVKELKLSDIAESIDYIFLETNEKSLIDRITKIKLSDQLIYLNSRGSIFQFDIDGKFVKQLFKVGRGPGETYSRNYMINQTDSLVYVYGNFNHTYSIYNFEGELIRTFKDPGQTGFNFIVHNGVLIFDHNIFSDNQYFFQVYNIENLKLVFRKENPWELEKHRGGYDGSVMSNNLILQTFQNKILFKEVFNDTLFQTKDFLEIKPRYVFDLSKRKLTYEDYFTKNQLLILDKVYIKNYIESSRYLILYISASSMPHYLWIHDKVKSITKTLEVSSKDDLILQNDIDFGPDIHLFSSFSFGRYDSKYLYTFLEPKDLLDDLHSMDSLILSNKMLELAYSVNEGDNPILVRIKLKD